MSPTAVSGRAEQRRQFERFREMMLDASVPAESKELGAMVYFKGPGRHEIAPDEFRDVTHDTPTDTTLSNRLRVLDARRYVKRRAGGRGHSDNYEFSPDPWPAPKQDRPPCVPVPKPDSPTPQTRPKGGLAPGGNADLNLGPGRGMGLNAGSRTPVQAFEVVTTEEDGGEEGVTAGGRVDAHAEEVIRSRAADLGPGSDALRTYLRQAVEPERQEGYARGVLAVLDGGPAVKWSDLRGQPVRREDRPAWIAEALIGLCTDEPTGRPRGSIHNFHTKLTILLKTDHERYDNPGGGDPGGGNRGGSGTTNRGQDGRPAAGDDDPLARAAALVS